MNSQWQTLVDQWTAPAELGFGKTFAPLMMCADFNGSQWSQPQLHAYGPLNIDPGAKVFHYAQSVFEGLKVYWVDNPAPSAFRLADHAARFNTSARALALPELPQSTLKAAIGTLVCALKKIIPRHSGTSLYLRPVIMGTDADLSVTASQSARFMLLASPSEVYQSQPLSVWVAPRSARAKPGGLGSVKASANYAQTLPMQTLCKGQGHDQVLWTQPDSGFIDELSAMNLFAVFDETLVTPSLTDTLLPGITRDSIITLVKRAGMAVEERPLGYQELCAAITRGQCTEVFASGTAATVIPVYQLVDEQGCHALPHNGHPVAADIYAQLLDIQEGRAEDADHWLTPIT